MRNASAAVSVVHTGSLAESRISRANEWSPTLGHFVGAELEEEGRRKRDRDCLISTIHSIQFQVGRDPVAKPNTFFFLPKNEHLVLAWMRKL